MKKYKKIKANFRIEETKHNVYSKEKLFLFVHEYFNLSYFLFDFWRSELEKGENRSGNEKN